MRRLAIATLAAGLLAVTGCVTVHEHDHHPEARGGPPPWAPAHGYRHKHHGHDLVYDAHIGVYVVVGFPHVYFDDGHYFRHVSSGWERCGDFEKGHWKSVDVARVPDPLVKHYAKKRGHGKGKGNGGPAKHWED